MGFCLFSMDGVLLAQSVPVPSIPDTELYNPRLTDKNLIAPSVPNWRIPDVGKIDFRQFILPPPPTNTSAQTALEMQELVQLAQSRNDPNVRASIRRWNDDPPGIEYHKLFASLMQTRKGYTPPYAARCEALLSESIYIAMLAAWYNKYLYLRPRPDQVSGWTFRPDPEMQTPSHPSYPSGHSATAGAFLAVALYCFPKEDPQIFLSLVREASLARRQGGVHYYSDSVAGEALGYAVAIAVVEQYKQDHSTTSAQPGAPVYSRPPSGDQRSRPVSSLNVPSPRVLTAPGDIVIPSEGRGEVQMVPMTGFLPPPPVKATADPPVAIPDSP
jgi:membrane-associated phospholipid phosphatase